jgi:hypothetical protein
MFHRTVRLLAAAILPAGVCLSFPAVAAEGVKVTELDGKVRVEINGELFTEYVFQGAPHAYFWPVLGPGGARLTRAYPMVKDAVGEEHDHHHHRSLWYSHGAVNGVDFWAESAKSGKIVHDRLLEAKSGADAGVVRASHQWIAPDGAVVCTDEWTFRVYARPANERVFDFDVTLKAGARDVVFGDTKEGSMAMRIAESMKLRGGDKKPGKGRIVNSEGQKDDDTWGKRARWCDYYGPVDGRTVGVAIFDHPQNPRHPTYWHVRFYGLFGANPFGIHDFTNGKEPKGAGDFKVPAGQRVTFRYRFYLHEGDTQQAQVAARYQEYATGAK